jgi:hypothetical protein
MMNLYTFCGRNSPAITIRTKRYNILFRDELTTVYTFPSTFHLALLAALVFRMAVYTIRY